MSQLNSLLESSANNWKSVQSDAARLADKWEKTGLLEGMGSEVNKNNMSMILENQAKQLVVEQSQTDQGGFAAAGGAGAQWAGVALPLVRKVFGQIAAKEFVSVQPMNLPSGLVFFLDFQYGQEKEIDFGAAGPVYNGSSSLYGDTNPGPGVDPTDGLYGAGRFGYSVNQFSQSVSACTVATASWSDVDYDAELSASIAAGDFTTLTLPSANLPDRVDTKGIRAMFAISGSQANYYFQPSIDNLRPQYSRVESNGDVKFVYSGSVGGANVPSRGSNVMFYNVQPTPNHRGDFEDAAGAGRPNAESTAADALAIPSIDVKMKSEAIVAKTRKLKAQWTPEFAQDLNAYHSVDAEAELTSLLSEYISMEIDLEILDMLIVDANTTDRWSAENNKIYQGSSWTTSTSDFYNTQGQWFQTLGTKIQKVSNKIHQKTLRGGANFVVTSPTVATILESIPGYAAATDGDQDQFAMGVQKVGALNNRYQVYKNPYMTENILLLGYRGSQFLEAGAVYAPYVPLMMTPLVYDPETFTPRKGLMTRYAKKMIRPEFYGKIFISDLTLI